MRPTQQPNQTTNGEKDSKNHLFAFIVIIFCFSITVFEIGLRWVGLGDPILYRTNTSYRYAIQPDQHKERIRGAWVTIDSHGLRTVQDWTDPDNLKILFIGDSVTWGGTAVDDRKTFAHLVSNQAEQRLGRPVVAGNAGVNGYGIDNMTYRLQYENLEEDLLVVVLISGDTIRGLTDIRSSYFFTHQPPRPLSALYEFTTFSLTKISAHMRSIPATVDSDSEAVATQSLNRLFDVLREKQSNGIPILLVLSPYEDELYENAGQLTQHVRHELANSGFWFLDLYPLASNLADKNLYTDGVHLNENGHAVYANEIAKKIVELLRDTSVHVIDTQRQ